MSWRRYNCIPLKKLLFLEHLGKQNLFFFALHRRFESQRVSNLQNRNFHDQTSISREQAHFSSFCFYLDFWLKSEIKSEFFDRIDFRNSPEAALVCFSFQIYYTFPSLIFPSKWEFTFISAKILNLPVSDSPQANLHIENMENLSKHPKIASYLKLWMNQKMQKKTIDWCCETIPLNIFQICFWHWSVEFKLAFCDWHSVTLHSDMCISFLLGTALVSIWLTIAEIKSANSVFFFVSMIQKDL